MKLKQSHKAHKLLTHLLTTPQLADNLKTLHDLALYESGDALLGVEEKEALHNVRELADRLKRMGKKSRKQLIALLR